MLGPKVFRAPGSDEDSVWKFAWAGCVGGGLLRSLHLQ